MNEPVFTLNEKIRFEKIKPNPKTHIGNFFAQNDAIYDQEAPSNPLFHKEVFALTQSLHRGGRILLTMRLYTNQDAGNILWEYAFEYLGIYTPEDNEYAKQGDVYFISADNPELRIESVLAGYATRDPDLKVPQTVIWNVEGLGGLDTNLTQDSDTGVFRNKLTMPRTAGASGVVVAKLNGTNTESKFDEVVVLPGKTADVVVNFTGTASVQGIGDMVADVRVIDAHGNDVLDGTSLSFSIEGDAYLGEYKGRTTQGRVSTPVKGGLYSGTQNSLIVEVGSLRRVFPFEVNPLNVEFVTAPASSLVNQLQTVSLRVTDHQGQPVDDAFVDVSATHGRLSHNAIKTDASGLIGLSWHTGSQEGSAQLFARVDGTQQTVHGTNITLSPPPIGVAYLQANNALVVGDSSVDGSSAHQSYSGASNSFDYQVATQVKAIGAANETVNIELDNMTYPNREPLMQLATSRVFHGEVQDAVGLHNATVNNVIAGVDHPLGVGRSLWFGIDSESKLEIEADAVLNANRPSFRFSFKPSESGGMLLNHSGGQTVSFTNNRLQYQVGTSDGAFQIESDALALNQWHTVAGSYDQSKLKLQINNVQSAEVTATGTIAYNTDDVSIGQNYKGWLHDLALYDTESPALLQFDNMSESQSVTLDTSGEMNVVVSSTGNLMSHQTGSVIKQLPVGIHIGEQSSLITVISQAEHSRSAGMIADGLNTTPTFSEFQSLYADSALYQDDYYLAEKVVGVVSDVDQYTQSNALTAVIGALDRVPYAGPIKAELQQMQQFYSGFDGLPMVNAAADVIGSATKAALKGHPETLNDLMLPLKVMSEMISDHPQAASFLGQTVKSKEDFQTWMEYLSLPAEGWFGLHPPKPDVDSNCLLSTPTYNIGTPLEVKTPCRLTGKRAGAVIYGLSNNDVEIQNDPHRLVAFIDRINEALPVSPVSFRKMIFAYDENLVAWHDGFFIPKAHAAAPAAAGVLLRVLLKMSANGIKNFNAFLAGRTNSRLNPMLVLASMAYVYDRATVGCTGVTGICNSLQEWEDEIVYNVIPRVLGGIALKGNFSNTPVNSQSGELTCRILDFNHGYMFELVMMAYFNAIYEATGDTNHKIVGIQTQEDVQVSYIENNQYKEFTRFDRYVDIQLDRGGSNRKWIELKSVQAHRANTSVSQRTQTKALRKWPIWNMNRKIKSSYYRQFYADRIAATDPIDGVLGLPPARKAMEFEWYLLSWKDNVIKKSGKVLADTGISYVRRGPKQGSGQPNHTANVKERDFEALKAKIANLPKGGDAKFHSLGYLTAKGNKVFEGLIASGGASRNVHDVVTDFYWDRVWKEQVSEHVKDHLKMPEEVRKTIEYIENIDTTTIDNIVDQIKKVEEFFGIDVEFDPEEFLTELGVEGGNCNF